MNATKMKTWNIHDASLMENVVSVYGENDLVNTIFYSEALSGEDVMRELLGSEGFPPTIRIVCEETGERVGDWGDIK